MGKKARKSHWATFSWGKRKASRLIPVLIERFAPLSSEAERVSISHCTWMRLRAFFSFSTLKRHWVNYTHCWHFGSVNWWSRAWIFGEPEHAYNAIARKFVLISNKIPARHCPELISGWNCDDFKYRLPLKWYTLVQSNLHRRKRDEFSFALLDFLPFIQQWIAWFDLRFVIHFA